MLLNMHSPNKNLSYIVIQLSSVIIKIVEMILSFTLSDFLKILTNYLKLYITFNKLWNIFIRLAKWFKLLHAYLTDVSMSSNSEQRPRQIPPPSRVVTRSRVRDAQSDDSPIDVSGLSPSAETEAHHHHSGGNMEVLNTMQSSGGHMETITSEAIAQSTPYRSFPRYVWNAQRSSFLKQFPRDKTKSI